MGNLLLVDSTLNERLANKTFQEKKGMLQGKSVWVDSTIANATEWRQQEVTARTDALAKLAYKTVWSL